MRRVALFVGELPGFVVGVFWIAMGVASSVGWEVDAWLARRGM